MSNKSCLLVYYLEYGPFSSHAPTYDSSFSNLNKEESDLLMTTYGDENAYQYALRYVCVKNILSS